MVCSGNLSCGDGCSPQFSGGVPLCCPCVPNGNFLFANPATAGESETQMLRNETHRLCLKVAAEDAEARSCFASQKARIEAKKLRQDVHLATMREEDLSRYRTELLKSPPCPMCSTRRYHTDCCPTPLAASSCSHSRSMATLPSAACGRHACAGTAHRGDFVTGYTRGPWTADACSETCLNRHSAADFPEPMLSPRFHSACAGQCVGAGESWQDVRHSVGRMAVALPGQEERYSYYHYDPTRLTDLSDVMHSRQCRREVQSPSVRPTRSPVSPGFYDRCSEL